MANLSNKESAYSKSPWFSNSEEFHEVRDAENGRVCILTHLRGRNGLGGRKQSEEVIANARLIAAAPELLAALKGIYYALVSEPIVDGEDNEDCWLLKPSSAVGVMQNALAAIAKAEGRS